MKSERRIALEILLDVEKNKAYSNITINQYLKNNKGVEGSLVREIVYGVIENKLLLDYYLSILIKSGFNKLRAEVLIILRMGLYQLIFLSGMPEYAIVNESVKLTRKFSNRHASFVNAVMRNFIRQKSTMRMPDKEKEYIRYLSVKYSYEQWMIEKWLKVYPRAFTEELLKAGNETPDITIRVNTLKTEPEKLRESLLENGFEVTGGKYVPEALTLKGRGIVDNHLFRQGFYQIQDESSMLAVKAMDPKAGDLVIDVCAAPGGKSLFAAEMMKNKGRIIARDIHQHKLDLLDERIKSHGIDIIQSEVYDAMKIDASLANKADKVLVDAPCSGLGVIRRKPEIKYNRKIDDFKAFNKMQYQILENAASYVKNKGVLIYSTCTIASEENQEVIKEFLARHSQFSVIKPDESLFDELVLENNMIQLFPNKHETDGFFICKMLKNE